MTHASPTRLSYLGSIPFALGRTDRSHGTTDPALFLPLLQSLSCSDHIMLWSISFIPPFPSLLCDAETRILQPAFLFCWLALLDSSNRAAGRDYRPAERESPASCSLSMGFLFLTASITHASASPWQLIPINRKSSL